MEEYTQPDVHTPTPDRTYRVPRATQRFLGVVAHQQEEQPPVQRVQMEPEPWSVLMTLLERSGTSRGGPLFGSPLGDCASVTDAAHSGYHRDAPEPFSLQPSYILGWSDCLSIYGSNDVDWIGYWLMDPDNRALGSLARDHWVRCAARRGLVDERHFLLFIGVDGEQVKAHAYLMQHAEANEIEFLRP